MNLPSDIEVSKTCGELLEPSNIAWRFRRMCSRERTESFDRRDRSASMHPLIGERGEREPADAIPRLAELSKKKPGGGVTMLRLAATLAIYAALISVSSADQAYLGEKEVRDLIAGNTVHGRGLQRGIQFQSFYDLNGKWRMEQSGTSLSGP